MSGLQIVKSAIAPPEVAHNPVYKFYRQPEQ